MSDTLADLASWLPSEFLAGEIDDKTLFSNPHRLPYDFSYSSSTESESDDDDFAGLTRRFTRSVSLQERLKTPYPVHQKKGVFSGSPESTLNWNVSGPAQARSSPTTPFVNRGLLGAPRPPGLPLSHHNQNYALWRSVNEAFLRQQRVSGGANYASGGRLVPARPVGFGNPTYQDELHRRKQVPVLGGGSRANSGVKKGCAGTGVFLPRSYPPEPKKEQACSPAHLPARVAQSFNKNMCPIIAKPQPPQPNINGGFSRQYQAPPLPHHNLKYDELEEMMMGRRQNGLLLPQQGREGVPEKTRMGQAEVVLPQEWTY
ncbi:hypothetical protein SSX86_018296 [Deinandra increscens subsp. villosa]|uniref:Uncharacterized protein n=1 Tax=Deinandra increscens subsp. villosa TaxID=3103831 RepID=A0AAP0CS47_9ASTR